MSDTEDAAPPPQPDAANPAEHPDAGPARALTLHLLRMLETRMDAAGIAINSEVNSFTARLQLKLLAAGALFMATWGGIVLIAIALPEAWRIPVLAAVIVGFVLAALWAMAAARRKAEGQEVGSMRWFMEGLRRDLEVLSRTLTGHAPQVAPMQSRSESDDHTA
jgi:uncharacterized membrane protein YqjE